MNELSDRASELVELIYQPYLLTLSIFIYSQVYSTDRMDGRTDGRMDGWSLIDSTFDPSTHTLAHKTHTWKIRERAFA